MGLLDGEEHTRDDAAADSIDMVGEDEAPEGIRQIDPLKGLLDPENGVNSPAADTGAPVPPG
jgi:hypothetical protein